MTQQRSCGDARMSISTLVGDPCGMSSPQDKRLGAREAGTGASSMPMQPFMSEVVPAFDTLVQAAVHPMSYGSVVQPDGRQRHSVVHTRTHPVPQLQGAAVKSRRGKRHRCLHEGCGREFTRLSNLKAHGRKHSGVEPYACMYCARRFKWRSSLKSHENGCVQQDTMPRAMVTSEAYASSSISSPYDARPLQAYSKPYDAQNGMYITSVSRSEPYYTLPSLRLPPPQEPQQPSFPASIA
jgi:hypothetical protein